MSPSTIRVNDNKNEILKLYQDGKSLSFIARKFNCSKDPIHRILREFKYPIRTYAEQKALDKKYHLKEDFFEKIDSEAKAYILGFLMADGYVKNQYGLVRVCILKQDQEVINYIKTNFETNKELYFYTNNSSGYTDMVGLGLHSHKMVNDLCKLGCVQAKSLTLKFPEIEHFLLGHFIRGYFDGDGCACFSKEGKNQRFSSYILSANPFITKLQKILNNLKISSSREKLHGTSETNSRLSIRSTIDNFLFYKFLYENSTFCLQRKKDKFLEFFKYKKLIFDRNPSELDSFLFENKYILSKNGFQIQIHAKEVRSTCKILNLTLSKFYEAVKNNKTHKGYSIIKIQTPRLFAQEFVDFLYKN